MDLTLTPLTTYLLIGLAAAVLFSGYSLRVQSLKADAKNGGGLFIYAFTGTLTIGLWPLVMLWWFWDMNRRRNGMERNGGGYVYAKRGWVQFLADEWNGREGSPAQME